MRQNYICLQVVEFLGSLCMKAPGSEQDLMVGSLENFLRNKPKFTLALGSEKDLSRDVRQLQQGTKGQGQTTIARREVKPVLIIPCFIWFHIHEEFSND